MLAVFLPDPCHLIDPNSWWWIVAGCWLPFSAVELVTIGVLTVFAVRGVVRSAWLAMHLSLGAE